MARAFCIPGIVFLACAFVLSFLAALSLPFIDTLDVVRVHFNFNLPNERNLNIGDIRLGVWAPCAVVQGKKTCAAKHHGYEIDQTDNALDPTGPPLVKSAWTRGLAVHPVAAGVTLIAFLLSLSSHLTVTLLASLVSFLAALLTLIAFAIDIALLVLVRHSFNGLNAGADTTTGPAFWLTFVSLILLLLGGCTVCFGHRSSKTRSSSAATNYPMQTTQRGKLWGKLTGN